MQGKILNSLRRIFGFIILITLTFLIISHIRHGKNGEWGYIYPVIAQQKYDLSCASGQPFQPLVTQNPQTGNLKANGCIDSTGLVTFNGPNAVSPILYLSPNCGATLGSCILIPSGGGCFNGAITNNGSGVVTFQSGFPSPTPVVGQIAWVMTEHGNNPCGTAYSNLYTETNYAGSTGSGQITIIAVNPGVSITLSTTTVTTQNGFNSWLFYGPNIFTQMRAACAPGGPGGHVHIAQGFYVADNSGNGTTPACGNAGSGGALLEGEGQFSSNPNGTGIFTPPWYNHNADTGTILTGSLANITLDGTWTSLGLTHGTPIFGGCGSHDFSVIGYNFGGGVNGSETFYPGQGNGIYVGNCEIRNAYMVTGDRAISGILGRLNVINSTILAQSATFLCYGGPGNNGNLNLIGGYYQSAGTVANGITGVIGCPVGGQTPSGDQFMISDAELCMTGNGSAINALENSGEIRLSSVKINNSPQCVPGTNATAVTMVSGNTLRAQQTIFGATGTGNTIVNPSGASYFDNCGNSYSGGAGYSGGGLIFGNCSITGTTLVAGNVVLSAGWGTTATVTNPLGDSRTLRFTVTSSGTGQAANPTMTITFPTPFLTAPVSIDCKMIGGTGTQTAVNGESTATTTQLVETFSGTPVAASTYIIGCATP